MALETEIVLRLGGDALLCLRLAFRRPLLCVRLHVTSLGGLCVACLGRRGVACLGLHVLGLGLWGSLGWEYFLNAVVWSANNLTNMHPVILWPMRFVPDEKPLGKFILGWSQLL